MISRHSLVNATNGSIFHDFVPFSIQQDLATLLLGFFFQFFQKFVVEDIWSTKILSRNLKKSKKIQFFSMKSYFLLLNLNSTCSQLSFEVYNVSVAQNLKFCIFLGRKSQKFSKLQILRYRNVIHLKKKLEQCRIEI